GIRGALARFGRGYAPPCARPRGNPETMNQNSHSNWINKWGLARERCGCARTFSDRTTRFQNAFFN
ncbi:MAG: hypothetical protein KA236_02645, partial [Verrucomicrobia bacterium]|nr:hypothetical protein [Verrucomicrobiota bacterium]